MKIAVAVLVVLVLALGAGLLYRHQRAEEQRQNFQASIQVLSNDLTSVHLKLDDQTRVNARLETDLASRTTEIQTLTNQLGSLSSTLAKTEAEANAAAEAAKAEVAKRDAKIGELETERDQLTKRMADLNVSISNLESQIGETQRKLAASEGDREFLLKELKRLQAEKAQLERQFSDLAVLREQVRKLKDDLSIARRLDWIRRGLYGTEMKGAERLQKGFARPAAQTNYDLNVEVRRDGSKIVTPLTNAPAPAPAPAAAPTPR